MCGVLGNGTLVDALVSCLDGVDGLRSNVEHQGVDETHVVLISRVLLWVLGVLQCRNDDFLANSSAQAS